MNVRMPMRVLRSASRWYPDLLCFSAAGERAGRVALTFDDGPHAECTPRLLDVLGEAGVHATFFMQGSNAVRHPELVRRVHREGHQVAQHGVEHVSALEQGGAEVLRNADGCHAALVDILGAPVQREFRPPYGEMTLAGLRELRRSGYRLAYWSWDSNDSFVSTSAAIVERLRRKVPAAGSILLFHDDYAHTAEALPGVIASLREMGLSPVTVGELCPR